MEETAQTRCRLQLQAIWSRLTVQQSTPQVRPHAWLQFNAKTQHVPRSHVAPVSHPSRAAVPACNLIECVSDKPVQRVHACRSRLLISAPALHQRNKHLRGTGEADTSGAAMAEVCQERLRACMQSAWCVANTSTPVLHSPCHATVSRNCTGASTLHHHVADHKSFKTKNVTKT